MTHSLTLGSLLLTGDKSFADAEHGYWFEVAAEGTDFGSPQAVTRIVTSLLSDGAIVSYDSDGNRVIPVRVRVNGPTLAAVAQGEAALRRESKVSNDLTWQPPDVLAPPSVYDTYPSPMSREYDGAWDLDDLQRRVRTIRLELTCSPFARSADPVTLAGFEAGTTSVTIDTCDSATGWTGTRSGAPEAVLDSWTPGSVGILELDSSVTSPETWTMTRTGSIDFTATPFLVAEIKTFSKREGLRVTVTADGVVLPALEMRYMTDGLETYRVTFDASAVGVVSSLTFTHTSLPVETWQGMFVRDLKRTDIPPNVTSRQLARIVEVGGTERTPASIHVSDPAAVGLGGVVIVHTSPEDGSGYSPPLRRWRTADSTGPETVDAGMLSGKREPVAFLAGGFVAEVPTTALPEGGYVLMARMRMATDPEPVNVAWSTSTIFPDTTTQQGFTNGSVAVPFATTAWHLIPLAALSLPSVRTKAGKVQIVIQVPTVDHAQVELDEAWLFRADDDCALTIVRSFQPDLWLDSPDVSSSVPRVWIGDGRDLQVHPGDALDAIGNHVLSPEGTSVFTAALVNNPATEVTFYRRWHSNAAE